MKTNKHGEKRRSAEDALTEAAAIWLGTRPLPPHRNRAPTPRGTREAATETAAPTMTATPTAAAPTTTTATATTLHSNGGAHPVCPHPPTAHHPLSPNYLRRAGLRLPEAEEAGLPAHLFEAHSERPGEGDEYCLPTPSYHYEQWGRLTKKEKTPRSPAIEKPAATVAETEEAGEGGDQGGGVYADAAAEAGANAGGAKPSPNPAPTPAAQVKQVEEGRVEPPSIPDPAGSAADILRRVEELGVRHWMNPAAFQSIGTLTAASGKGSRVAHTSLNPRLTVVYLADTGKYVLIFRVRAADRVKVGGGGYTPNPGDEETYMTEGVGYHTLRQILTGRS